MRAKIYFLEKCSELQKLSYKLNKNLYNFYSQKLHLNILTSSIYTHFQSLQKL